MTNLIMHLQSPSQPYLVPFLGSLGAQGAWWHHPRRHHGEVDGCSPPSVELMHAARSTSAVKMKQLFYLVPLKSNLRHPFAHSKYSLKRSQRRGPMCSTPPAD